MAIRRRESPHGFVSFVYDYGKEYQLPLSSFSNGVSASYVGAFPPKQVIGDFTRVSHEVLSSMVQSDWSGGGQITDSQEATDTNRYADIATVETRYPNFVSLLPLTRTVRGPNDTKALVLGDFLVTRTEKWLMVSFGSKLRRLEDAALTATEWTITNGTSEFTPTAEGVTFGDAGSVKFYIPGGSSGYATFNSTAIAGSTAIQPLNFVVHDLKLWALDISGALWRSLDGAAWTKVVTLPAGYQPKSVAVFVDRFDNTTPHIVTDSMVFTVDAANNTIYETELGYAPHPDAGLAAERWRADLYVSIGLGIQRYTLGTVNATGIDRDDGPGLALTGRVASMARGFNDLFVLISGALSDEDAQVVGLDEGDELYVSDRSSQSAVMRLSGTGGWHTMWVSDVAGSGLKVGNVQVSAADGLYRIVWGWNGDIYWQTLPYNFENPRVSDVAEFAQSGEITSSWLDMGMTGIRMTMAAVEVRTRRATPDTPITVEYQIDGQRGWESAPWMPLGTITEPGFVRFRVGRNGDFPDGQPRYDGAGFSRMRYRVRMERTTDDVTVSPILESVAIVYIKKMGTLKSFRFRVDCSSPELDSGWGLGNRDRQKLLERMMESEEFIPFSYNDKWYAVKIAGVSGNDSSGMDLRGDRDVTVIESFDL